MKQKELIKRLEKIHSMFTMPDEEFIKNFTLADKKSYEEAKQDKAKYAYIAGIAQAYIKFLIDDIKEEGVKNER